eukprot:GEMP01065593.1.p1 GENE.GEMP01065593.1~~GEMP01065593.1.p1  ORF type:complete len:146 (+),score=46.88 GEMP01065593.1:339-776(+)
MLPRISCLSMSMLPPVLSETDSAKIFESPHDAQQPWARPGPKVYAHWEAIGADLWTPLPPAPATEVPFVDISTAEILESRLRRVVTVALQHLPAGIDKPTAAKRWGKEKQKRAKMTDLSAEDAVDMAAQDFLAFLLEDVKGVAAS